MKFLGGMLSLLMAVNAFALWEENSPTPINGLYNPYNYSEVELESQSKLGMVHALNYPVEVTGLLLPYAPLKKALDSETDSRFKKWIYSLMRGAANVESFDGLTAWLGLHRYPEEIDEGPYYVPRNLTPENRMGFSLLNAHGAEGFTFSCAACHSANLFGQRVLGLTNRKTRANEYFIKGKKAFALMSTRIFKSLTDATEEERQLMKRAKRNLRFIEARKPLAMGLDTSLAHVALSLSHRAKDEYATKRKRNAFFPRHERLRNHPADSKPGVWWNVKYKNKWLLDGSVVSGNPILTNILWNEIGRGTDLHELENWIANNQDTIEELTTAVFNAKAPQMTDFFGPEYFDLEKAQQGQQIYNEMNCKHCHGSYYKVWDLPGGNSFGFPDVFATAAVNYPAQTLVKNVGTDPLRWQGMTSLEQLNDLAISKKYGVKVKLQEGYVPPPLVGIWARWPYFHNNSIPSLCALFTRPEIRPEKFYVGPADDPVTDFNFDCNGFPLGEQTPKSWRSPGRLFDTSQPGMRNTGHYKMFLDENGREKYTVDEKRALIHFLQTL